MERIDFDKGIADVLDSLLTDRLVLLAGAGLSMDKPSNLPSAKELATSAKQKYEALYGSDRETLAADVESQAEFFFQRGELGTVYFRTLVDKNAFAGRPNPGHSAAADLLLVRAIQTAITTNVDTLIETAGQQLFGQVGVGIDQYRVATLPPDVSPLLKIHGCRSDPDSMVWAPGQLVVDPVKHRISFSTKWLNVRLLDRDLLIVGYWTDWDYLNKVLATTLGAVNPTRVIVVDVSDSASFKTKAPALYKLGIRASNGFQHVKASGADFLDSLRQEFSKTFVRGVLHSGKSDYLNLKGSNPEVAWTEPANLDNDTLWQIRRDLEGQTPNSPAKERKPPPGSLVGLTLLQLQSAGAVQDGYYWKLNDLLVRVIRAVDKTLHGVEAEFEGETPPLVAPDFVIAVGAEAQSLPTSIVRAKTLPSIARGSSTRWLSRPEAVIELGL